MFSYSQEQSDVIGARKKLGDKVPIKVFAFAGAGKTTMLYGVSAELNGSVSYLAFNREIAIEAKSKFKGTRTKASTMHSLALGAVRHLMKEPPINSINAREISASKSFSDAGFKKLADWNDFRLALAVSRTMTQFAQSASETFEVEHAYKALEEVTGNPDLMLKGERRSKALAAREYYGNKLAQVARDVWVGMEKSGRFTHDMYLKHLDWSPKARERAFGSFDHIIMDEGQDSNSAQLSILQKTGLPLTIVGDTYQQIYSWRGAVNALDTIEGASYYLTQSFRFSEDIAAPARAILSSRPDKGPKQKLIGSGSGNGGGHTGIPWAIICRTNIGVIDAALDFLNEDFPIKVDNVESLMKDLRSAEALFAGETDRIESPEFKLYNNWQELKDEAEEGNQTLKKVVTFVERKRVKAIAALAKIQSGRDDSQAQAFLCTAHRSKGLEFPRVQLGKDWKTIEQMRKNYAKASTDTEKNRAVEEWNTLYVAATRSMVSLEGLEELF